MNTLPRLCALAVSVLPALPASASRLYVAASAITNVAEVAVQAGPAGTGSAQVTLCDNSGNYVNGTTGTAFLRDPDVSCDATTCRIFSCGDLLFGLPATLESPSGGGGVHRRGERADYQVARPAARKRPGSAGSLPLT